MQFLGPLLAACAAVAAREWWRSTGAATDDPISNAISKLESHSLASELLPLYGQIVNACEVVRLTVQPGTSREAAAALLNCDEAVDAAKSILHNMTFVTEQTATTLKKTIPPVSLEEIMTVTAEQRATRIFLCDTLARLTLVLKRLEYPLSSSSSQEKQHKWRALDKSRTLLEDARSGTTDLKYDDFTLGLGPAAQRAIEYMERRRRQEQKHYANGGVGMLEWDLQAKKDGERIKTQLACAVVKAYATPA